MNSTLSTPSRNTALRTLPADLIRSRELLGDLIRKDLRVRYRYAAAGFVWAVLEPLAYMALLTVVFQWIIAPRGGASMFGEGIPYAVGLLCGLVFWQFTSSTLSAATNSLIDNHHLVKKVNFTREIIPLATLGYPVVALGIGFFILIAVHLAFGGALGLGLIWVPLLLAIQLCGTVGLGLLAAAGNARYRDVGYMVNVLLVLGFYASPVFYDLSLVLDARASGSLPGFAAMLYLANPMAELLEAYRQCILEGLRPEAWLFVWPAIFSGLVLAMGAIVFRRVSATVSDYL